MPALRTPTTSWASPGTSRRARYGRTQRQRRCKRVKIDDNLPEAHISLALVRADLRLGLGRGRERIQESDSAERQLRHGSPVVRRFPDQDGALRAKAKLELKKAQELDPLSLLINTSIGRQLYFARQYDAAIEQLQKTLEMDPKFVPAQHAIGGRICARRNVQGSRCRTAKGVDAIR